MVLEYRQPPHGTGRELFRELAPKFVGLSLSEAAKIVGCTPGSLRARLSTEHFEVKIRKDIICSLNLPVENVDVPVNRLKKENNRNSSSKILPEKNITPVVELEPEVSKPLSKNNDFPYKAPTVIRLCDDEYNQLIENFRKNNHIHRRS